MSAGLEEAEEGAESGCRDEEEEEGIYSAFT